MRPLDRCVLVCLRVCEHLASCLPRSCGDTAHLNLVITRPSPAGRDEVMMMSAHTGHIFTSGNFCALSSGGPAARQLRVCVCVCTTLDGDVKNGGGLAEVNCIHVHQKKEKCDCKISNSCQCQSIHALCVFYLHASVLAVCDCVACLHPGIGLQPIVSQLVCVCV